MSESSYRMLLQHTRDAACIADGFGHISVVDANLLALLGFAPGEPIGLHVSNLFADPGDWLPFKREVDEEVGIWDRPSRVRSREGQVIPCLVTCLARRVGSRVEEYLLKIDDNAPLPESADQFAATDALTGLPNRAALIRRIGRAASADAVEPARRYAVLHVRVAPLDEEQSATATAELLVAVARRLKRCIRPADMAARVEADGFGLLLDGLAAPGDAELVAARIAGSLSVPYSLDGADAAVRVLTGIALPGTELIDDPARMLDAARAALGPPPGES